MTQESLTAFLGWMSVLNIGVFAFSAIVMLAIRGFAANLHARLFGIDEADVNRTFYQWMGLYKLMIAVFCLIPYLALRIIA